MTTGNFYRSNHTALQIALWIAASLFIVACKQAFKVQSESIARVSRDQYKSYKFFNPKNMPESNFSFSENNKKLIFDAVAGEMKKREFISLQEADLIIKIQGGTSRETENRPRNYYYDPYSWNSGAYGYPYYWSRDPWLYDDISKKMTSIIIDIIDGETKKLLWEGVGTGVLGDKPEEVSERIKQAVNDIFLQFPVPVTASQ
jgi:hypothetical protein